MKNISRFVTKRTNFILLLFVGLITFIVSSSFITTTVACGGPFQTGNALGNGFAILGPGGAGAPGEGGTCGRGGCHNVTDNTGAGSVTLDIGGGATQYIPGQTYTITVTATHPSVIAIAFEVTNRPQSGGSNAIGTFSISDATRTKKTNGSFGGAGNNYVECTACGVDVLSSGYNQWTFNWTAPITATGNITFYLGVVAANFNNQPTGDFTYSTTKLLTQGSGVGLNEITNAGEFAMYPNPAHEKLNITYTLKKESDVTIKIVDIRGSLVDVLLTEKQSAGDYKQDLNLNSKKYPQGIYFVHLSIDDKVTYRKLFIQ